MRVGHAGDVGSRSLLQRGFGVLPAWATGVSPGFVVIVAAALLLRLPALSWDLFVDDHGLMLVLDRPAEHPTLRAWNLFDFGSAEDARLHPTAMTGLPWWTSADWKARFFRPLASLTHWLDRRLFGSAIPLHHATSLAWFAVLLVLLHRLYRTAGLAPRLAAVALAIFACEDGSLMPVGWLANRNELIQTTFAVAAALVAWGASPSSSWRRIAAALALAGVACLAKESGAAAPLVVAAIFAWRARGSRRLRIGAGMAVALSGGYLLFLLCSGYGTRSLFYFTPWGEPLRYAARAVQMATFGALSLFGPFPVDLPVFVDVLFWPWLAAAVLVGGALLIATVRAARELPGAAFFAGWALLTLLPQAGAYPSDRLLFLPMVGAAPCIAALAARGLERAPWRRRALPLAVFLLTVPISGLALLAKGFEFRSLIDRVNAAATSMEVPRDGTPCDAVLMQAPSSLTMLAPGPVFMLRTGLDAVHLHPLQTGRRALELRRVDERTLDVTSLDEPFLALPVEGVFLTDEASLPVGTERRGRIFSVTILAAETRGPRTLRLRFDSPLGTSNPRLLTWRDDAFRAIEPPALGATLLLPRCDALDPLLP